MAQYTKIIPAMLLGAFVSVTQANVPLDMPQDPQIKTDQSNLAHKRFNIEWNVLPTVIGYASGSANVKILPAVAVGAYGGVETWATEHATMYNFGGQITYALNGEYMSDGWLLTPFIGYVYYKENNHTATNGVSGGVIASYQWIWKSGFNVQLGIGPGYASTKTGAAKIKGLYPAIAFNLGYAI